MDRIALFLILFSLNSYIAAKEPCLTPECGGWQKIREAEQAAREARLKAEEAEQKARELRQKIQGP